MYFSYGRTKKSITFITDIEDYQYIFNKYTVIFLGIRGTLASFALVSRLCGGQDLFSKETGSIYSSVSILPLSKYLTENPIKSRYLFIFTSISLYT